MLFSITFYLFRLANILSGHVGGSGFSNSTNHGQRSTSDSTSGNDSMSNTRLATRRLTSFVYNKGLRKRIVKTNRIKTYSMVTIPNRKEKHKKKQKCQTKQSTLN